MNLAPLSPRLTNSSIVRGSRSALPAREALILLALINHPWLLDTHAEEVAAIEFLNPDADLLRSAILDAAAIHAGSDPPGDLRALIAERERGVSAIAEPDASIEGFGVLSGRPWRSL